MCGRFSLTSSPMEVSEEFSAWTDEEFPVRFNIAPTQPILAIRAPEAYREPTSNLPPHDSLLVRWGFIPAWTKKPDLWPLTFNIRAETVAQKKSFRNALHYHRIIIPATGFYEWKKRTNKKSHPFFIHSNIHDIIGFAGLMETWSGAEGSQVDTAAILTRASRAPLSSIHNRMPVMIERVDYARWLDCRNYRPDDVLDILDKPMFDELKFYPVSDKINNVHYLGSDVQNPIELISNEENKKPIIKTNQLDLF